MEHLWFWNGRFAYEGFKLFSPEKSNSAYKSSTTLIKEIYFSCSVEKSQSATPCHTHGKMLTVCQLVIFLPTMFSKFLLTKSPRLVLSCLNETDHIIIMNWASMQWTGYGKAEHHPWHDLHQKLLHWSLLYVLHPFSEI